MAQQLTTLLLLLWSDETYISSSSWSIYSVILCVLLPQILKDETAFYNIDDFFLCPNFRLFILYVVMHL